MSSVDGTWSVVSNVLAYLIFCVSVSSRIVGSVLKGKVVRTIESAQRTTTL